MVKHRWAIPAFCTVACALKLLQPIPDQLVLQDTDFQMDVAQYFNEVPTEVSVEYPDFLSFASRHFTMQEVYALRYDESPRYEFLTAVAATHSDVIIQVQGLGLLVYELHPGRGAILTQHYFEDCICRNYSKLAAHFPIVALYNSSELALLDFTQKQFPAFLFSTQFPSPLIKAQPLSNSHVLVLTAGEGLAMYTIEAETGLVLTRDLREAVMSGSYTIIEDFALTSALLFVVDTVTGLRSVTVPDFEDLRIYPVLGKTLTASATSIWVDGRVELDLSTGAISATPVPIDTTFFAFAKGLYFYHNTTHLLSVDPRMNLTYVEDAMDMQDLRTVNESYILVLGKQSASVKEFQVERTVLHGRAPSQNGAFDVLITAKGKLDTVQVSFTLMVESPPLTVLLFLLAGAAFAGGAVAAGYFLFQAITSKKKAIAQVHMLTEEYSSSNISRQLGPNGGT